MSNMKPREGVEVVFIGDTHIGRRTETYDSDIARKRIDKLKQEIQYSRNMMTRSRVKIKQKYIVFLGDMIDGEEIYPAQSYEQEMTVSEQIEFFMKEFDDIMRKSTSIIGITGNHGRARKDTLSNWDYMLYLMIKERYGGKKQVNLVPENKLKAEIENTTIYIAHPYQVRMYQNIPFYGIVQDVMREYLLKPFDIAVFGHFHNVYKYHYNGIKIYGNGTMMSDDELTRLKALKSSNAFWYMVLSEGKVLFDRELNLL